MENETLSNLSVSAASALSSNQDSINWISIIILLAITAVGSYIGSYLQRKGLNRAEKENFQQIHNQLRTTTETTEKIKQEIHLISNRKDRLWHQRREKLEEFVSCLTEVESYKNKVLNVLVFQHHGVIIEPNPINKLMMLQALYFPEFEESVLSIIGTIEEIETLVRTLSGHNSVQLKVQVIPLVSKLRKNVIELMLASAKTGKKLESEI
ncbi:hypothetical protein ACRZOU_003162 [Aeromonas salmonicida]|uniref:hypothetical protein n=1 Tax=Aeromonas salmonicida TaxID=645 RepID=UPI0038BCA630